MIEIKKQVGLLGAQPVPVTLQPLKDATPPARPAAPAEELPYLARHFGSSAVNSRLPGILGNRAWQVKWTANLPAEPLSVIRSGDFVIAQWPGMWRLLNGAGKLVHEDYCGRSPIVVDASARQFQLVTAALSWEVRELATGQLAFRNALPYDENYNWPVLHRAGNRMLAFAEVQPAFRHGAQAPGSSLLQLIELKTPLETDETKLAQNLARFEALEISAQTSCAAAQGETLAMAAPGALVYFDPTLRVVNAIATDFDPDMLSMDEAGWVYVTGKQGVWMLNAQGARVAKWTPPATLDALIQPPIVGYDHRPYLLSRTQLVALGAAGELRWTKPVPAAAGAGVTIDGSVLVSAGQSLLSFDPAGQSRELHRFDAKLTTPPILTSHREILVGAGNRICCLA